MAFVLRILMPVRFVERVIIKLFIRPMKMKKLLLIVVLMSHLSFCANNKIIIDIELNNERFFIKESFYMTCYTTYPNIDFCIIGFQDYELDHENQYLSTKI